MLHTLVNAYNISEEPVASMLRVKDVWDNRFLQIGTINLTVVSYHGRKD
jgi:hypothetical protein